MATSSAILEKYNLPITQEGFDKCQVAKHFNYHTAKISAWVLLRSINDLIDHPEKQTSCSLNCIRKRLFNLHYYNCEVKKVKENYPYSRTFEQLVQRYLVLEFEALYRNEDHSPDEEEETKVRVWHFLSLIYDSTPHFKKEEERNELFLFNVLKDVPYVTQGFLRSLMEKVVVSLEVVDFTDMLNKPLVYPTKKDLSPEVATKMYRWFDKNPNTYISDQSDYHSGDSDWEEDYYDQEEHPLGIKIEFGSIRSCFYFDDEVDEDGVNSVPKELKSASKMQEFLEQERLLTSSCLNLQNSLCENGINNPNASLEPALRHSTQNVPSMCLKYANEMEFRFDEECLNETDPIQLEQVNYVVEPLKDEYNTVQYSTVNTQTSKTFIDMSFIESCKRKETNINFNNDNNDESDEEGHLLITIVNTSGILKKIESISPSEINDQIPNELPVIKVEIEQPIEDDEGINEEVGDVNENYTDFDKNVEDINKIVQINTNIEQTSKSDNDINENFEKVNKIVQINKSVEQITENDRKINKNHDENSKDVQINTNAEQINENDGEINTNLERTYKIVQENINVEQVNKNIEQIVANDEQINKNDDEIKQIKQIDENVIQVHKIVEKIGKKNDKINEDKEKANKIEQLKENDIETEKIEEDSQNAKRFKKTNEVLKEVNKNIEKVTENVECVNKNLDEANRDPKNINMESENFNKDPQKASEKTDHVNMEIEQVNEEIKEADEEIGQVIKEKEFQEANKAIVEVMKQSNKEHDQFDKEIEQSNVEIDQFDKEIEKSNKEIQQLNAYSKKIEQSHPEIELANKEPNLIEKSTEQTNELDSENNHRIIDCLLSVPNHTYFNELLDHFIMSGSENGNKIPQNEVQVKLKEMKASSLNQDEDKSMDSFKSTSESSNAPSEDLMLDTCLHDFSDLDDRIENESLEDFWLINEKAPPELPSSLFQINNLEEEIRLIDDFNKTLIDEGQESVIKIVENNNNEVDINDELKEDANRESKSKGKFNKSSSKDNEKVESAKSDSLDKAMKTQENSLSPESRSEDKIEIDQTSGTKDKVSSNQNLNTKESEKDNFNTTSKKSNNENDSNSLDGFSLSSEKSSEGNLKSTPEELNSFDDNSESVCSNDTTASSENNTFKPQTHKKNIYPQKNGDVLPRVKFPIRRNSKNLEVLKKVPTNHLIENILKTNEDDSGFGPKDNLSLLFNRKEDSLESTNNTNKDFMQLDQEGPLELTNKNPSKAINIEPLKVSKKKTLKSVNKEFLEVINRKSSELLITTGPSEITDKNHLELINKNPFKMTNKDNSELIDKQFLELINKRSPELIVANEPLELTNKNPSESTNKNSLQIINNEYLKVTNRDALKSINKDPLELTNRKPLELTITKNSLDLINEDPLNFSNNKPLELTNKNSLVMPHNKSAKRTNNRALKSTNKNFLELINKKPSELTITRNPSEIFHKDPLGLTGNNAVELTNKDPLAAMINNESINEINNDLKLVNRGFFELVKNKSSELIITKNSSELAYKNPLELINKDSVMEINTEYAKGSNYDALKLINRDFSGLHNKNPSELATTKNSSDLTNVNSLQLTNKDHLTMISNESLKVTNNDALKLINRNFFDLNNKKSSELTITKKTSKLTNKDPLEKSNNSTTIINNGTLNETNNDALKLINRNFLELINKSPSELTITKNSSDLSIVNPLELTNKNLTMINNEPLNATNNDAIKLINKNFFQLVNKNPSELTITKKTSVLTNNDALEKNNKDPTAIINNGSLNETNNDTLKLINRNSLESINKKPSGSTICNNLLRDPFELNNTNPCDLTNKDHLTMINNESVNGNNNDASRFINRNFSELINKSPSEMAITNNRLEITNIDPLELTHRDSMSMSNNESLNGTNYNALKLFHRNFLELINDTSSDLKNNKNPSELANKSPLELPNINPWELTNKDHLTMINNESLKVPNNDASKLINNNFSELVNKSPSELTITKHPPDVTNKRTLDLITNNPWELCSLDQAQRAPLELATKESQQLKNQDMNFWKEEMNRKRKALEELEEGYNQKAPRMTMDYTKGFHYNPNERIGEPFYAPIAHLENLTASQGNPNRNSSTGPASTKNHKTNKSAADALPGTSNQQNYDLIIPSCSNSLQVPSKSTSKDIAETAIDFYRPKQVPLHLMPNTTTYAADPILSKVPLALSAPPKTTEQQMETIKPKRQYKRKQKIIELDGTDKPVEPSTSTASTGKEVVPVVRKRGPYMTKKRRMEEEQAQLRLALEAQAQAQLAAINSSHSPASFYLSSVVPVSEANCCNLNYYKYLSKLPDPLVPNPESSADLVSSGPPGQFFVTIQPLKLRNLETSDVEGVSCCFDEDCVDGKQLAIEPPPPEPEIPENPIRNAESLRKCQNMFDLNKPP